MAIMERRLSVTDVILIAGTRVALGIGIGLLISDRFNRDQRRAAGLALVGVGAATTIPLAIRVIGKHGDFVAVADSGLLQNGAEFDAVLAAHLHEIDDENSAAIVK